jgi:HAD superfamily hydrolase (TIGR01484 family)
VTYQVALLDVDGTLRHQDRWHPGALELIDDLHNAGVQVALCSGRTTGSMIDLVEDIPHVDYLASSSGATALTRSPDGWEVLGHRPLPAEAVEKSLEAARDGGFEVWAFTEREWLIAHETPWSVEEAAYIGDTPRVADLAEHAGHIGKVLYLLTDPRQAETVKGLNQFEGTHIVQSGEHYIDLVATEAHTAKGGDLILQALGVEWSRVIAMGDGENDRGMLSLAGLAVCITPMTVDNLDPDDGFRIRRNAGDTAQARDIVGAFLAADKAAAAPTGALS